MALPKRKHSQARRDKRRSQWKMRTVSWTRCPQCGGPVLPHHVCRACGFYRGRPLVSIAAKEPPR